MQNSFAERKVIDLIGDKVVGEFETPFNTGDNFTSKDTIYFKDNALFSFYKSTSILAVCGASGEFGVILNSDLPGTNSIGNKNDRSWSSVTEYPEKVNSFGRVPTGLDQVLIYNTNSTDDSLKGFPIGYSLPGSCTPTISYSIDSAYNRLFYIETNGVYFKFQIHGYVPAESYATPFVWSKYIELLKIKYSASKNKNDIGGNPVRVANIKKISKRKITNNMAIDFLGRKHTINK